MQRRVLGDDHPDTLKSKHTNALFYSKFGRDQEAFQLTQQTSEGVLGAFRRATISSGEKQPQQEKEARLKSPRKFSRYLNFLKLYEIEMEA